MSDEIFSITDLKTAIASARSKLRALVQTYPTDRMLASALIQLDYIDALAAGSVSPDRKADLNLGFLGMRFIVDYDEELGNSLSDINHFANTQL